MKNSIKLITMTIISLALGVAIFVCVFKVGDLNGQADLLELCQENSWELNGCPDRADFAKVPSLRNTAITLGYIGWFSVLVLIFSVWDKIVALYNRFTD